VRVRAVGSDGRKLALQRGPGSTPVEELVVALSDSRDVETRDAIFAIPEASLIVRIAPVMQHGSQPTDDLLIQAYRSRSGELTAEAPLRGSVNVHVDDLVLTVETVTFTQMAATYDPGFWPTALGLSVLLLAQVASVAARTTSGRLGPDLDENAESGHARALGSEGSS
jgi:hypothetical protein